MDIVELRRRWHLGAEFKSGGFGRIYAVQSEAREEAVAKLIPKEPGASRELLFEELSGVPNVVPILDSGEWEDFWVLLMPRAEKSLREYIDEHGGPLILNEAIVVLKDVGTALAGIDG